VAQLLPKVAQKEGTAIFPLKATFLSSTVWPNVGIKCGPTSSKSCPKGSHSSFYLKSDRFQNTPKIWASFVSSKIAKSGPTVYRRKTPNTDLEEMVRTLRITELGILPLRTSHFAKKSFYFVITDPRIYKQKKNNWTKATTQFCGILNSVKWGYSFSVCRGLI